MTSFEFGDVVLVPFPFTDQSTTKKRPAIVVSSQTYNTERPDVIIMAVTSQARPGGGCAGGDFSLADRARPGQGRRDGPERHHARRAGRRP